MRAASVTHAEYEILNYITTAIDLLFVKEMLVTDEVSNKRFNTAGENVLKLIDNMVERRRHRLPKEHTDYQSKEASK